MLKLLEKLIFIIYKEWVICDQYLSLNIVTLFNHVNNIILASQCFKYLWNKIIRIWEKSSHHCLQVSWPVLGQIQCWHTWIHSTDKQESHLQDWGYLGLDRQDGTALSPLWRYGLVQTASANLNIKLQGII